jgi:predicted transcriptional regulator
MDGEKTNIVASNEIRKPKATLDEILTYIWRVGLTSPLDLANKFGYTYSGAADKLYRLKKRGRVINDRRGEWVVTKRGEKRLVYKGVKL